MSMFGCEQDTTPKMILCTRSVLINGQKHGTEKYQTAQRCAVCSTENGSMRVLMQRV